MSAEQIIEEIRALPADERAKVYEFVRMSWQPKYVSDQQFKQAVEEVFTKNDELFRKLAR